MLTKCILLLKAIYRFNTYLTKIHIYLHTIYHLLIWVFKRVCWNNGTESTMITKTYSFDIKARHEWPQDRQVLIHLLPSVALHANMRNPLLSIGVRVLRRSGGKLVSLAFGESFNLSLRILWSTWRGWLLGHQSRVLLILSWSWAYNNSFIRGWWNTVQAF